MSETESTPKIETVGAATALMRAQLAHDADMLPEGAVAAARAIADALDAADALDGCLSRAAADPATGLVTIPADALLERLWPLRAGLRAFVDAAARRPASAPEPVASAPAPLRSCDIMVEDCGTCPFVQPGGKACGHALAGPGGFPVPGVPFPPEWCILRTCPSVVRLAVAPPASLLPGDPFAEPSA